MTITNDRRDVLIAFVIEQQQRRMRTVRNWSAIGLVLCGAVAAILISVKLDGAEGAGDIVVPAVIAGGLALVCGLAAAYAISEMRAVAASPLIAAMRASPPQIARVEPLTIHTEDGAMPALALTVDGVGTYTIYADEPTRRELSTWLAR